MFARLRSLELSASARFDLEYPRRKCAATLLARVGVIALCALNVGCGHRGEDVTEAGRSSQILTPIPGPSPRINGPKVFGVRPGPPLRFQISATGERPLVYSAVGLPATVQLDSATGQIIGALPQRGRYSTTLRVENRFGFAERAFTLLSGDEIALTPPMGWNSFNAYSVEVTQAQVLAAARALARSGLRDHGWTYVNVDDGWQGTRGGPFHAIQPNEKFPDLPGLIYEVHELGLKFGIYSSPARTTFGWHIGSSADNPDGTYDWIKAGDHDEVFRYRVPEYRSWLDDYSLLHSMARRARKRHRDSFTRGMRTIGHSFVAEDVRQWADWGVDYLKYDWAPLDVPHATEMSDQLRQCGRDIVYTLANNAPLALGSDFARVANAWRTTGDVKDTWKSVSGTGFTQDKWAHLNRPGHYNDPDMLVLGHVFYSAPGPTRLTPDEQYTHMSLWVLLAGPLLLGTDLDKLDAFTLGLLTNDEVLDVHQDVLCKQATCVRRRGDANVYAKLLEDGSWAVGLFNRGSKPQKIRAQWADLHLTGSSAVRDLWRQKDLGTYADSFETVVAAHGVVLIKVSPEPAQTATDSGQAPSH